MTEVDWLTGDDLPGMVVHLVYRKGMERKYHLFALECVRTIRDHLLDHRSLELLEFVEENSDELFRKRVDAKLRRRRRRIQQAAFAAWEAAQAERQMAQGDNHCHPDVWNRINMNAGAAGAAHWLLHSPPSSVAILCDRFSAEVVAGAAAEPYRPGVESHSFFESYERQRALNLAGFRDIFGNPFRPVAFDPAWLILALGAAGTIERVEVDTAHYKGNYPDRCSLQAARVTFGTDRSLITQAMFWPELMGERPLGPDAIHVYEGEDLAALGPVTHVKLNIHPDGGVSRLRIMGRRA
jgi:hypothetical protein